jgi:hypothetical protein
VPMVDDLEVNGQIWNGPDRKCDTTAAGDDQQVRALMNTQPNVLTGFDDWTNLKFDFQNAHDYEDGVHVSTTEQVEIDLITHLKNEFDVRLEDDSSGDVILIDSRTGEYRFSRCGPDNFVLVGRGLLIKRGCYLTLQNNLFDRRVQATFDTCTNRGSASLQYFSLRTTFTVTDRNTTNNALRCM